MLTEKELIKLKEEIEATKTKASELRGEQNAILTQLKTEWECNSVEEGQKKLSKLEKELTKIKSEIEEKSNYIEETYLTDEE
jgi:predicted  nucleic acid-binding Zn-ribbon protein